jgi:hypothetical protein
MEKMNSVEAPKELDSYQLKDMAETLMKAHEIQGDPELMKQLEPLLKKKAKAVKSIADLKKIAQEKAMEESEDPKEESAETPEEESAE